jgi:hypothetical protein
VDLPHLPTEARVDSITLRGDVQCAGLVPANVSNQKGIIRPFVMSKGRGRQGKNLFLNSAQMKTRRVTFLGSDG